MTENEKKSLMEEILRGVDSSRKRINRFAYLAFASGDLEENDIRMLLLHGLMITQLFGSRSSKGQFLHSIIVWGLRPQSAANTIKEHRPMDAYDILLVPGFELPEKHRAGLHIGFADNNYCLWAYHITKESLEDCLHALPVEQEVRFLDNLNHSIWYGLPDKLDDMEKIIRKGLSSPHSNTLRILKGLF